MSEYLHDAGEPSIANTLSAAEAAQLLGVSTQTIRQRIQRGELGGMLVRTATGKAWRVIRSGALADSGHNMASESQASAQHSPLGTEQGDDSRFGASLAQLPATLPQPGVVEALALLRGEMERNAALATENCELLAANARLREQLAAATPARPLLLAEAAPALGLMERLDRWWWRFIGADREPRASS